MIKSLKHILLYSFLLILILVTSCSQHSNWETSGQLTFSEDTINFDTVFTTIGTTTKYLIVKNPTSQNLLIKKVYLAGGTQSYFRLNINGIASQEAKDVEIPANDSIFIFIEATIDPTNQNSPMVISDSIMFSMDNATPNVKLIAYGQDVHLFNAYELTHDTTFINDKPYLIYNYLYVDSGVTLNIQQGCKIHFHHNSSLYIKGKLIATGTKDEPIWFLGDRLEDFYENIPGQWDRIAFFQSSKNNQMTYCNIKNSIIGVQLGETPDYTDYAEVTLNNVKIFNTNYAAIFSMGGHLIAKNTILANSGYYEVALLIGGTYKFYHCTINNYWSYGHRSTPSIILSNNLIADGTMYVGNITNTEFGNCIIYGDMEDEIGFSVENGGTIEAKFNNCLVRSSQYSTEDTAYFNNQCIFNQTPIFVSTDDYDFHLQNNSPAINKGDYNYAVLVPQDYDGNDRTIDSNPDLGAFENQANKK